MLLPFVFIYYKILVAVWKLIAILIYNIALNCFKEYMLYIIYYMNNTEIILIAVISILGLIVTQSTFTKISDKIYEHKKVKPSDWHTKTRTASNVIYPDPLNPIKFKSKDWLAPTQSYNDIPRTTTTGGTRKKIKKRKNNYIKKSR